MKMKNVHFRNGATNIKLALEFIIHEIKKGLLKEPFL